MEKNNLDHIITYYLEEEQRMELRFQECLLEKDFLMAHHFSKIINGLKHKIALLSELDTSKKLKIQRQELSLSYLEKKWQAEENPRQQKNLKKFIEQAQQKIANWQKQTPVFFEDKQLIDDIILDLWAGKISGFSIVVDQREAIRLDFKCTIPPILTIKIKEAKSTDFSTHFWKSRWPKLQGLGFVLLEGSDSLRLDWSMDDPDHTQDVKLILARLFFEVFYYKDFGSPLNLIIEP